MSAIQENYVIHHICDNCEKEILGGSRFHCFDCDDFDLCPKCSTTLRQQCFAGHPVAQVSVTTEDAIRILDQVDGGLGRKTLRTFELHEHRPFVGVFGHREIDNRNESTTTVTGSGGSTELAPQVLSYESYGEAWQKIRSIGLFLSQLLCEQQTSSSLSDESGGSSDGPKKAAAAVTRGEGSESTTTPRQIAIFLPNCPEWIYVDVASTLLGYTIIPMDPTATQEALAHILLITDVECVFTCPKYLQRLMAIIAPDSSTVSTAASTATATSDVRIKTIVCLESETMRFATTWSPSMTSAEAKGAILAYLTECREAAAAKGIELKTTDAVINLVETGNTPSTGQQQTVSSNTPTTSRVAVGFPVPIRGPSSLWTLFFTSGSTGVPKGVMETQETWLSSTYDLRLRNYQSSVVYRPFCYASEREVIWRSLCSGGRVAVFAGGEDLRELFLGMHRCRPTAFSGPPRIWSLLHQMFQRELHRAVEAQRESAALVELPEAQMAVIRTEVLRQMTYKFGNRLDHVVFGGAPTPAHVIAFIRELFSHATMETGKVRVHESYGTSESGGIAVDGVILSHIEARLLDVPELGFLSTNSPNPQGEVLVINSMGDIPGYWRDAENTDKLFFVDDKGRKWIRTGDIGERVHGRIRLLERRSNVVKLSSGTMIAPEHLEGVFVESSLLRDVYVHAEPGWDFPLAVVTIDANHPRASDTTTSDVLKEFRVLAREHTVPSKQIPHDCIIASEAFTRENLLLTVSQKLARPALRQRFGPILRTIYEVLTSTHRTQASGEMKNAQHTSPSNIPESSPLSADPVRARIRAFVVQDLKVAEVDFAATLPEMGADSIVILLLHEQIKSDLGVDVAFSLLYEATLGDIIAAVSQERGELLSWGRQSSDAPVFGEAFSAESMGMERTPSMLFTNLLEQLESDCSVDDLFCSKETSSSGATTLSAAETTTEGDILLTGATGFIGSEILLQLSEMLTRDTTPMERSVRTVYCLVRGASVASCQQRLLKACLGDATRSRLLEALFEAEVVVVVPADLSMSDYCQPSNTDAQNREQNTIPFGIDEEMKSKIFATVRYVIHCAAQVNHVMPYGSLRSTNIGATKQLLAWLFVDEWISPRTLVFASTASVVPFTESASYDQETPLRGTPDFFDALLLNENGYSQTKAVAEQVVTNFATRRPQHRYVIMRVGMTSWARGSGRGNTKDWLVKFCNGVSKLGIFPTIESPLSPSADTSKGSKKGREGQRTVKEQRATSINIVPVSDVARCFLHVTNQSSAGIPKSPQFLHLVACKPFPLDVLFGLCGCVPVDSATYRYTLRDRVSKSPCPLGIQQLRQVCGLFGSTWFPSSELGYSPTATMNFFGELSLGMFDDVAPIYDEREVRTHNVWLSELP